MKIQDAIFRVIDTEGTDREPSLSHVCEVAWRDVDFAGKVHGRFHSLIDPGVPIPPSASAVHHLVDADVSGKSKLADIAGLLPAPFYVAQSWEYDATVLGLLDAKWLCTHRLAKHLWPQIGNHSNQEIRYTLGLKVDLEKDAPAHRAQNDVAVTAAILAAALPQALAKWPGVETVEDLIAKVNAPALILRIPFKSAGNQLFEHAETSHLEWIVRSGAGGTDCVHTARHWLQLRYSADTLEELEAA